MKIKWSIDDYWELTRNTKGIRNTKMYWLHPRSLKARARWWMYRLLGD